MPRNPDWRRIERPPQGDIYNRKETTMRTLLARSGLALLAASACFAAGCAEERDPINRVQPNRLPKSFFLGPDLRSANDDPEFRMKSFVAGNSANQEAFSIGEFSSLERVRWEITEGLLIARRSYQESPGADNRGLTSADAKKSTDKNVTGAANGTIVAAFKISKHFDVRRDYNASTGEEMNVVVENDSDRPWQEREFIRVDWSKNLVDSTTDRTRYFKTAKVTPVEYNVTDETLDDAPHFEEEAGYLDVTNKFTVEAEDIQFSWGPVKKCILVSLLSGTSSYDCNPQEATVRTSFAKVQPDEDFERFEDNYQWKDVVGNTGGEGDGFNTILGSARTTWDPQYGFNDAATHRFKSIHNIWKKSHQDAACESNVDVDENGTADACENGTTGYAGHSGAQCDVAENRCTLPVRDRELRTIAYFLNPEAPDAFQDVLEGGVVKEGGTLEQIGKAWSQMIEVSVAYRREVECRRTHDGDRAACHAEFFESDSSPHGKQVVPIGGWLTDKVKAQAVDQGKPGFYVCHNPVRDYDPAGICGKPGDRARPGDVRKNFLVYWPYETRAHYGGVGWNPSDPVSGETFGATATVLGRSATRAAATERDIIQLAMGDTKMDEILQGVPAERYSRMIQNGAAAPLGLTTAIGAEERNARAHSLDLTQLRATVASKAFAKDLSALETGKIETIAKANSVVDGAAFTQGITSFAALAENLRGVAAISQESRSSIEGFEPAKLQAIRTWYNEELAAKGTCFDEAANSGTGSLYLASLAPYFKNKYGSLSVKERGERIYDDLVKETIKGIALHEVGHSLGLRHNFASSWDAPNFNPQYWQLRTDEGRATAACKETRSGVADSCMGPRYLDPMTADEQGHAGESRPGIDYFANTSTMEYQIERGGESIGLGTYDQHAMKVLYGRVIETLDDKIVPPPAQLNFAYKNYTQLQERDIVVHGNEYFTHYTETARLLKVFDPARDCRVATEEEKATNGWRIVHGKVCAPPSKDHWAFGDFKSDPRSGITPVKWHAKFADGVDKVRWNYRWGEQYGAGGYMHTMMMDAGADIYELVQNLSRSFELRYPWSYFRRGDREWNGAFLSKSVAADYFGRLRGYHWQVAIDLAHARPEQIGSDDGLRPYVMAQSDIFAFLQRAILMPEPGAYAASSVQTNGARTVFDVVEAGSGIPAGVFNIGVGDGRYLGASYENDKGGSWDYQKYVHHAGFDEEKALAMMQLVDPRPTLFTIARETLLDERNVHVNFRSDLPGGVDRLLGGILSEDWESISPHVVGNAGGGVTDLALAQKAIRRPADAKVLFPNIGYNQQLNMLLYGAIFSRLGSDMTLLNKMRLTLVGDAAPTVPGAREVRFQDPETGFSYVANSFGDEIVDGRAIDLGVASRMVGRANQLLAEAYAVKKDLTGSPVIDDKGALVLELDAKGRPIATTAEATMKLRRYVGLLDTLRQVTRALDGPRGGAGREN